MPILREPGTEMLWKQIPKKEVAHIRQLLKKFQEAQSQAGPKLRSRRASKKAGRAKVAASQVH